MASTNKNKAPAADTAPAVPTGGSTWDGSQQKVATQTPITDGIYDGKLRIGKMTIAKADRVDAVPRVSKLRVEVMDNGVKKSAFVDFHLGLKPGSDGNLMPNRNGQIVEFQQTQNSFFEAKLLTHEYEDDNGQPQQVQYIDPVAVVEYLKTLGDCDVRVKIVTKKQDGRDPQSTVNKWLPRS